MKTNPFKTNKITKKDTSEDWQKKNRNWWENNPMRYDWKQKIKPAEHTIDFYKEIDERFFSLAEEYMPYKEIPFDPLIPYEKLKTMDVLEIGVGNGSHAQLLAMHAKSLGWCFGQVLYYQRVEKVGNKKF